MNDGEFAYDALRSDDGATTSIIAYQERAGAPFRAVIWSVPRQQWIFAPAIAAEALYDDDPQTDAVDRAEAERIATEVLRHDLPSEGALLALCEEGERNGWSYGPPR
ncbi:hypothetical protein [Paractinoplanes lichenicola]|uniref:Uncharacterized protein n=1 Tax=Paractinoplanes lichenicola TaxID=2802976 RepID=A0ABS1W3Y1_9ACTN|nr:hypothetical protein [Actinoplanes lichenicola]MBL7261429.1 hypothetical protein [Actinoplanes lichenicola]